MNIKIIMMLFSESINVKTKIWSESLKVRTISIIATTAYDVETDKEQALNVGMDDYISKPIDLASTHK